VSEVKVLLDQREFSESVFLGAMLGDAGMSKTNVNGNARFRIGHSINKSEYLMWKLKHLRELVEITQVGIIKGGVYEKSPNDYVYFTSRRDPYITEFYERLYIDGRKTFTEDLINRIDEIALSVLFMDDGSYDSHIDNLDYWLHFNSHEKYELEIMIKHLEKRFQIYPKIQKVNKGAGFALRFLRRDSERIDEIIRPVVSQIECMRYKLHFDNPNLSKLTYSKELPSFSKEASE